METVEYKIVECDCMPRYKDWNSTHYDIKGLGSNRHNIGQWLVFPVMKTRDSDILTQCNYECVIKAFENIGYDGESDNPENDLIQVHSFNHWACGYFDLILVNPFNETAVNLAIELTESLNNYPVLNDERFSELQLEDQYKSFKNCYKSDYISELEKQFPELTDCLYDIDNDILYEYFNSVADSCGIEWELDSSGSNIDYDSIAENSEPDAIRKLQGFDFMEFANNKIKIGFDSRIEYLDSNDCLIRESGKDRMYMELGILKGLIIAFRELHGLEHIEAMIKYDYRAMVSGYEKIKSHFGIC